MEKGKTVAQNRKAWHDYFVEETYEAGIELCGTEVKSIRLSRAIFSIAIRCAPAGCLCTKSR